MRALIIAALLTACGGTAATPEPTSEPTPEPTPKARDLTGTLTLTATEAFARFNDDSELDERGKHCVPQTTHGYTDIESGMQIVVKDETGAILATGRTTGGEIGGGVYEAERAACVWTFTVEGVGEADFYTIEAGRRGGPTYSLAEMEAMDWTVALEIGN